MISRIKYPVYKRITWLRFQIPSICLLMNSCCSMPFIIFLYAYCLEQFVPAYIWSSWFRQSGAKAWSFIIQKFYGSFSPSFNVSVDTVQMFLSCSMVMIFLWFLKSWSCLLKCLQAGIALGFLTSFLWLLSLMLNDALRDT